MPAATPLPGCACRDTGESGGVGCGVAEVNVTWLPLGVPEDSGLSAEKTVEIKEVLRGRSSDAGETTYHQCQRQQKGSTHQIAVHRGRIKHVDGETGDTTIRTVTFLYAQCGTETALGILSGKLYRTTTVASAPNRQDAPNVTQRLTFPRVQWCCNSGTRSTNCNSGMNVRQCQQETWTPHTEAMPHLGMQHKRS